MTQTKSIAEGDRIYATEDIWFDDRGGWGRVTRGTEGTVIELTGDDGYDLYVEWDSGWALAANSGSVALI